MNINIFENGIYINIHITEDGDVYLLHIGSHPQPSQEIDENFKKFYRLVEVHETGMNQNIHHGSKHTGTCPGYLLRYQNHIDYFNEYGRKLEIVQSYNDLTVTSHIQFYHHISVIKCWTSLQNNSNVIRPIEYISSFALTGLSRASSLPRDKGSKVYIPHSTWYGEAQWKSYTLNELGYDIVNDRECFSVKPIALSNTGSWASCEYLPMGSFEHSELNQTITWQIETSSSWHWEISDSGNELYLQLSGPTYTDNHFIKNLRPNESFISVACALSFVAGDFECSIQELTKYRRAIRRPNKDNENPAVIFNDYMNCLMGDPTTEKLIPLIDAAHLAGCDYFCIDCGWYAPGYWWDGVGEWLPSLERFPNGIEEPLNYIRSKGMIPGLWLELEVMGINCPMVDRVPKDWFFQRNGIPLIDEGRYQLDYRNKEVRAYADSVIKRLVEDYNVGYIKMDYNIDIGPGTDKDADSAGEGLLAHTRAYLSWLDAIFEKYPNLIIENCSSGGMRMDYSMLCRHSIQSVTDQTNYIKMAAIAANCMTAVTPEQAAIWSYPLREGTLEEVVFNMVNSMLFRIHQSGHLGEITPDRLAIVKEGIRYHKEINNLLKDGLPFWPLGLASFSDEFLAVGIDCGTKAFLAVWHTKDTTASVDIPLQKLKHALINIECSFPTQLSTTFNFDNSCHILHVSLPPYSARIFEISFN
ncbi:alpha-galactosidase [Sporanaerobium hydrogeniformans]|uniref:Alpha-galactosidase n=1 Tax=Sporanaerobium hydrogeniformans TaxID=3072179 RepID=A0AC61DAQ7_9FIRM|nr:glycoside hydrolase family 36 protein [Sporanaerobium hydrogeniformans]PHV69617.1 alpha-galactosidase [Sporanaerobium hydrogeniformans]